MKVKFKRNHEVIVCEFTTDLIKNNAIEKILQLFDIPKVYVSVYGVRTTYDLSNIVTTLSTANYWYSKSPKSLCDLALEANTTQLIPLLHTLGHNFDEMLIWSCYAEWDSFLKDVLEPAPFFTFALPKNSDTQPSFFLRYSLCDYNEVEIVCDKKLNDTMTDDVILRSLQEI